MNTTNTIVRLVAGLTGSAYIMYGEKKAKLRMELIGIVLCIVPYFIGNTILLAVACLAMIAAPFASDAPTMADTMEGHEDSATRDHPQSYNREKI
jgi:hypothetical protein